MSVWRRIILGASGALALCLLVLGVVLAIPATETGSRWLVQQLPGVQVEGFKGRLLGDGSAEQLHFSGPQLRLHLQQPAWAWQPLQLVRGVLAVEQLSITHIQLETVPSTAPAVDAAAPPEEKMPPLTLPTLPVAVSLRLEGVALGTLQVNQQTVWNALRLDAAALALSEQWPLHLQAHVDAPVPASSEPLSVDMQLDGALAERVNLDIRSVGYVGAHLTGWLEPLQAHLPTALEVTVHDMPPLPLGVPPTLRPQTVAMTLAGNQQEGYRLALNSALAGQGAPVPLTLAARLFLQRVEVERLALQDAKGAVLALTGRVAWQDEPTADFSLESQAFDWQSLYPMPGVDVALAQLKARVNWRAQRYQGEIGVGLHGPAGLMQIHTPFNGDAQQVHLPALRLDAGSGHADAEAHVHWGEQETRGTLTVRLAELNPAYWHKDFPGRIGGELTAEGRMSSPEMLLARGQWALAGALRGQPLEVRGQFNGEGARWQVPELVLRLGDNRLSARGTWNNTADAQADVDLRRLEQLLPGLGGALKGNVQLSGSHKALQGRIQAEGKRLFFAEQGAESFSVQATLDARQQVAMQLHAQQIRNGVQVLGNATAEASGTLEKHRVMLALTGDVLPLRVEVMGALKANGDWQGQLSDAHVSVANLPWSLQSAAYIQRRADGRVTLSAHCWQSEAARLCAEPQRLLPEPQLRWQLQHFALNRLAAQLPPDLALEGQLNAEISLDLPASGPRGSVRLDAGQGQLRLRQATGDWVAIPYQSLYFDSRLQPRRIENRLSIAGPQLGTVTLTAALDPRSTARTLDGTFTLNAVDVALLRPFLPQAERLTGSIEGSGNLSGTLTAPLVHGRLAVRDVQLSGAELPLELAPFNATLWLNGETARLDGQWRSGKTGYGTLAGDVRWLPTLAVAMQIQGQRLPAGIEPYLNVEVEPNLKLSLKNNALSLGGTIAIPRGKIEVPQLPEQTIRVSEDARIVGATEPPAPRPMPLGLDIQLVFGADRLQFSGFGLQAKVRGDLHLRENLDSRGTLTLEEGRYRSYGQNLTLRRARLLFAGPVSQPLLDIEAVRTVDSVTAGVRLSGRSDAPLTEVFAEPSMSQEQALAYLVLGRPLGSQGDQNRLSQAALALGLAGGAPVARGLAERLGINDFQLESEGSGQATSMVASGYLTHNLSLRYGMGLFEPASTLALRYDLSRKLYLEAASGIASSLDVFYKKDY